MLMPHTHPALQFNIPLPYGAILHESGVQFVVFSRSAIAMRVLLYETAEDREPCRVSDPLRVSTRGDRSVIPQNPTKVNNEIATLSGRHAEQSLLGMNWGQINHFLEFHLP